MSLAGALLLSFLGVSPARAAFQVPPVSAREMAVGQAGVALERGADAIFVNPAMADGQGGGQVAFDYGRLFMGLPGVAPIGIGSVAATLPVGRTAVSVGAGQFDAAGLLQELTLAAGVSRAFGALRLGIVGKRLSHRYLIGSDPLAAQDPVFAGGTGRAAYAVDVGALWNLGPALSLGAAARNLNEPDVGLASLDRVPRVLDGGLVWRPTPAVALALDVSHRDGQGMRLGDGLLPAAGIEVSPGGGAFTLRAGGNPREMSAGFGIRWGPWRFDYGATFALGLMSDNSGTHRVGLTYSWGRPD